MTVLTFIIKPLVHYITNTKQKQITAVIAFVKIKNKFLV